MITNRRSEFYSYGGIALAIGLLFWACDLFLHPSRVGDGGEYYALYLAWLKTHRPFMTAPAWVAFGQLADLGQIAWFVSLEWLQKVFPALSLGVTADLNHFWFYSLLAALSGSFLSLFGLQPIHSAFLLLHAVLLCVPYFLARRYFGWRGVIAVSVLTFLSPMFWYVDKVHTEFFTYCLTLAAVILFMRRNYIPAAFCLAMSATQNISFGAVAAVVLAIDWLARKEKKYSCLDAASLCMTMIIIFLHPAYYFSRYGVIDPQLLTGGAEPGVSLPTFYVWFFDPDIGLLPNWPLGLAIIMLASGIAFYGRKCCGDLSWWAFLFFYMTISLYAQCSTSHLNSGGTVGIARYALWYICLFFPLLIMILEWATGNRRRVSALLGVAFLPAVCSFGFYRPQLREHYTHPSPVSVLIQKHMPFLYDPPPEIFADRYGGIGESPKLGEALAVIGPDCNKVLLWNRPGRDVILGGKDCGFDTGKLSKLLKQRLTGLPTGMDSVYVRLTAVETKQSR